MTRLLDSCPCSSQKLYQECCKPYHDGALPENALKLMRSRYSAYAMHKAGYIIQTTHPKNRAYEKDLVEWEKKILEFCSATRFNGLEIVEFIDGHERAYVTFIAHLRNEWGDASFREKSTFEKVGDQWLYWAGEVGSI